MFNSEKFIKEAVKKIRQEIKGKTLIAFSGGVDSTVCASLVNKAIGDNLIAVNVDTGYMRKNEPETIKKLMEHMKLNYRFIDASDITGGPLILILNVSVLFQLCALSLA